MDWNTVKLLGLSLGVATHALLLVVSFRKGATDTIGPNLLGFLGWALLLLGSVLPAGPASALLSLLGAVLTIFSCVWLRRAQKPPSATRL